MRNLLSVLATFLAAIMEKRCVKIGEAIEDRDPLSVLFHTALLVLYIIGITAAVLGFVALIMRFWEWLVVPAILLWIIFYYASKKPQTAPAPPPQPVEGIAEVRARAEKTYPTMKQTAYLLLTDLCRYLPGLVTPFSLSAVTAPVNFDITASLVTQFHFVIAKGQCDAPTATVKDILDRLVFQHLQAHDLPISIPAIYTAADGSTWPSLVVDGVYDLGNQYRVDLVITNEAEVAALKAKGLSGSDKDAAAAPRDPDFD